MGWTSMHREAGCSNAEFVQRELLGERHRILEHHTERMRVFYAAVETVETGQVWGLVVLMQWTRDWFNFTYKDIEEEMGPGDDGAPAKVLDLLSETTNEYAQEWRARCRARVAVRQANRDALVEGAVVRLPRSLRFSDGVERDTFTYRVQHGRKADPAAGLWADGCTPVRIPGWREMSLDITTPELAGV